MNNMATQKVTIDLKKTFDNIGHYFKHLPKDMIIAWSVLGLGIVLIIVGVLIL